MINRQGYKYSYGRQAQMNVIKRETLFCPINEANKPDYKYIVSDKRVHKSRFKKANLKIENVSITETQAMKNKNILRVYDCGKIKFELNL